MSIHSKFLIHWAGWDFDPSCSCPSQRQAPEIPEENLKAEYIERLRSCCEKGLWMGSGTEEFYARHGNPETITGSRVCFTEIRLSDIKTHAEKYGKLGIGFDRDFVIERRGNPVFLPSEFF